MIVEPLTREWEEAKTKIEAAPGAGREGKNRPPLRPRPGTMPRASTSAFLERLKRFRVLDPACGSGNFLYLALLALKELEHRVNLDAEALGFQRAFPQ